MRAIVALATLALTSWGIECRAEDISGTWQGADKHQHVLKISKSQGSFRGELYNLGEEQGGDLNGNPIEFTVNGRSVKFKNSRNIGSFEGGLDVEGSFRARAATISSRMC